MKPCRVATFSMMFPDSGEKESQTTFRGSRSSLADSMARIKLLNEGSTLITQGPPERRLLNASEKDLDKQGNIRRLTFGVKNPKKKIINIVILGETGTGKSSFINVMTNYILGVEWSDNICYEIIKEKKRHQAESQTTHVTVYEIFGCEDIPGPFALRIIDTPGYSYTKGKDTNGHMVANLCHLFQCEDGVNQIDAVCLVVKASQNRLTDHQRCIFDAVLSLFGKDMKKNIIPVITFSGCGKPAALVALNKFSFPWCRDESNNLIYFKFNNPPEDEDYDITDQESEAAWNKRKQSLQAFLEYVNNLETRSLVMTHNVLFTHEMLQCCVRSLQDLIVQAGHKQNEIRQTQEALGKNKKKIEENNNFEYVVEESFAEKVQSDSYATCCKKCEFTCHHPCKITSDYVFWCAVTKFKDCESCPGKCSLSNHERGKMRYVPSVRKVKRTLKNLKEKYEEASRGFENLQEKLEKELSEMEGKKQKLILESYNHIIKLNETSLRPEPLSILLNINFLIEMLREMNQNDKARKLKDIYKRAMETHSVEEGLQSKFMKFIASLYW